MCFDLFSQVAIEIIISSWQVRWLDHCIMKFCMRIWILEGWLPTWLDNQGISISMLHLPLVHMKSQTFSTWANWDNFWGCIVVLKCCHCSQLSFPLYTHTLFTGWNTDSSKLLKYNVIQTDLGLQTCSNSQIINLLLIYSCHSP